MNFIVKDPRDRTVAAANYVYEVKEFAERMIGNPEGTSWSDDGHLILDGVSTGWRIFKHKHIVAVEVPA